MIVYVGDDDTGTLTISGGQMNVSTLLVIGQLPNSTGQVWIAGGAMVLSDLPTLIGNLGVGQMVLSNGTVTASQMVVSNSSAGTLSIQGGTLIANLTIKPAGRFRFRPGATGGQRDDQR